MREICTKSQLLFAKRTLDVYTRERVYSFMGICSPYFYLSALIYLRKLNATLWIADGGLRAWLKLMRSNMLTVHLSDSIKIQF